MASSIVNSSERQSQQFGWRTIVFISLTTLIGFVLGDRLGFGLSSSFTGVVAGLIAVTGSRGRFRRSMQWSLATGLIVLVLGLVATLTAGHIIIAAILMAIVAFMCSWLSSSAPAGLLLSLVGTLFYVFASTFAVVIVVDQKRHSSPSLRL